MEVTSIRDLRYFRRDLSERVVEMSRPSTSHRRDQPEGRSTARGLFMDPRLVGTVEPRAHGSWTCNVATRLVLSSARPEVVALLHLCARDAAAVKHEHVEIKMRLRNQSLSGDPFKAPEHLPPTSHRPSESFKQGSIPRSGRYRRWGTAGGPLNM